MSLLKKIFGKTTQAISDNIETASIFKTHKNKIYPWIKVLLSDDTPAQLELKGGDSPIFKSWLGDLAIFYVADMDNRFQVLLERDLPTNITKEDLHQLAIDNLNRDIEFRLHETNFGGHGLIAGGNHEAGSICLPAMWDWLLEHFSDNLIIAIPAKDLVFVVPESDPDKISNLKIYVHQVFKNGDRLLTRNIFKLDKVSKEWTIVERVS